MSLPHELALQSSKKFVLDDIRLADDTLDSSFKEDLA